jgi:FkbM family methyltransferase
LIQNPRSFFSIAKIRRELLYHFFRILPREWKRKLAVHLGKPDVRGVLSQLRQSGFSPTHVMDVGEFQGDWARICMEIFPSSHITCIEPQELAQGYLHELVAENPKVQVIQARLGRTVKESVPFQEIGSGSSVWSGGSTDRTRPMKTVDALIESGCCCAPELLKLDVPGYELEVLEGFTKHFACCQVIQCEISLMPIVKGAPLIKEMVAYLHAREFVMFDVTGLFRSTSDGALWQMDAIFCRIDSPLRSRRVWESMPYRTKVFSEW